MDRQALQEELTVQEVILQSLEGEAFPNVEKDRDDARAEIQRLKRALKVLSKADTNGGRSATPLALQRSEGSASSPGSNQGGIPAVAEPSSSRRGSTVMRTPRKPLISEDGFSPASLSLRSKKRDFESTNLRAGRESSKSRRTTPTPLGNHSRGAVGSSSDDHVDIIDLTGADVDEDSTYIAQQIKQAERLQQVNRDREIAILLSSQGSQPSSQNASGPSRKSGPEQPSAFSRIMATQRSNALPSPVEIISDDEFEPPSSGPRSQGGQKQANRRNDFSGLAGSQQPQAHGGTPIIATSAGAALLAATNRPLPGTPPYRNNQARFGSYRQMPGQFPGLSMMPGVISTPKSKSTSLLSDLINRTSMYDYANGLDDLGNPLPDHLMDYINDSFHDPRVTEQELDDLLKNIRPDTEIPENNRDGTPEGLKNALYPHQSLALTWMKQMEDGTNKGGILADDMGLGKTISTLALMLSRPAKSRPKVYVNQRTSPIFFNILHANHPPQTNLIIGPLALIRQWEEEIYKKTRASHRLSVFVYHNKKATTDDLLKFDVVLTTYGTIAQELKRLDKFMEENASRNIDFRDRAIAAKFPLLNPSKATFHRIILDEAQCIKNQHTKTAKACHKLKAEYRWCLTGTPMMNGVLELFSLICFLRIKPYCVWEQFRQSFGVLFGRNGDPKSVAMTRLRALLKAVMLRRKKDSQLDGKPILRLPQKSEEVVYADLSGDERDFYNQLERKSQVQFSKYLRDGSVGKNYSSILVLLLRLRQACCHPHLNLDVDDTGPMSNEEMLESVKQLDASIVERIKEVDAFECPICYDAVQSPMFFIPCGHDSCQQCLTQLADTAAAMNLQEGNESDKAKCPVCRTSFDPRRCFTYEAFQKVYMPEFAQPSDAEDDASESSSGMEDELTDDDDDEEDRYGNLKGFIVQDDVESNSEPEEEEEREEEEQKKTIRRKSKRKPLEIRPSMLKTLRHDASKNKEAFKRYMRYLRKTWLPAAKVSECMDLLQRIYATGEKTIVFSQWTLLLDLLEVAMWHDKYPGKLRRYDGSMSSEQRFVAARDFREKNDVKVMLVSLRAGNAGLNLTAASRVVIMDPFWNPYIEMQAIDRAYRIGQHKEVKVYRILTKETVEDRIVELQERKKEMVEAALDEAESSKIGRLNVNELKFLFNGR